MEVGEIVRSRGKDMRRIITGIAVGLLSLMVIPAFAVDKDDKDKKDPAVPDVETTEAEVKHLPKMHKDVDVETGKKVIRLIDALDDHDDVQNVYTDANLTAEMADA